MPDSSQRERITQYIQDTYGTEAEYLWADSPGNAIFRHSASKKWYAALMRVLPEKLGLTGVEALDVMDIKCSTIMIGSLLATKGFLPAYHMNKNHWISIVLDNSVPDSQIRSSERTTVKPFSMAQQSFGSDLTLSGRRRRKITH